MAEMCILVCNMSFLCVTRYVLFLYGSLDEIDIYCTSRCLIITGERSFNAHSGIGLSLISEPPVLNWDRFQRYVGIGLNFLLIGSIPNGRIIDDLA